MKSLRILSKSSSALFKVDSITNFMIYIEITLDKNFKCVNLNSQLTHFQAQKIMAALTAEKFHYINSYISDFEFLLIKYNWYDYSLLSTPLPISITYSVYHIDFNIKIRRQQREKSMNGTKKNFFHSFLIILVDEGNKIWCFLTLLYYGWYDKCRFYNVHEDAIKSR